MIDLAIISSGFQAVNLKEYIYKYKTQNIQTIVLYRNIIEKKQIINTAKILKININFFIQRKFFQTYFYLSLLSYFYNTKHINNLIIGNLNDNHFLFFENKIKSKKSFLIDDGTETLANVQKYYNSAVQPHKFLKLNYPRNLWIFSFLKFKENKKHIIKNNFDYLRSLNIDKRKTDLVYFIGQPYLGMTSEEEYYNIILKMKLLYKNKLFYIPHRSEEDLFINRIVKELEINILKSKIVVECKILLDDILPQKIISLNSTALLSISELDKYLKYGIDFYYIEILNFQTEIYTYLKRSGVKKLIIKT